MIREGLVNEFGCGLQALLSGENAVMRPSCLSAIASMLALCGSAHAFEQKVSDPDFTVTVPNLPSIRLETQAAPDPDVSSAMSGDDGTYKISLVVTRADRGATAQSCAGVFLRALVARPGMPDRDGIYRAALDQNTFLVLYILGTRGGQQLHAHLLSSASATHCIEAHFSRARHAGEHEDDWRKSFSGSHIQQGHR